MSTIGIDIAAPGGDRTSFSLTLVCADCKRREILTAGKRYQLIQKLEASEWQYKAPTAVPDIVNIEQFCPTCKRFHDPKYAEEIFASIDREAERGCGW